VRLGLLVGLCLVWSACAEAVVGTGSENLTAGATQDASFPKDATNPNPEEGGEGADANTNTGETGTDTRESFADDHLPDAYNPLCAEEMPELDAELVAASIMLVMDRSGSMVGAICIHMHASL
jgi:hypothetical protein